MVGWGVGGWRTEKPDCTSSARWEGPGAHFLPSGEKERAPGIGIRRKREKSPKGMLNPPTPPIPRHALCGVQPTSPTSPKAIAVSVLYAELGL